MKHYFIISILSILAIFQVACGQTHTGKSESSSSNQTETKKEEYPNLKIQANEVGKATLNKDYEKVLDYTHPKVLEMSGGREKMLAGMKQNPEQVMPEGFELLSVEIDDASQIEKIDNQIFAIVPMNMTIKSPDGKFLGESYLVGVSDNGENWKFISGVGKEGIKILFPKAADVLKFPEQKPPKKLDS